MESNLKEVEELIDSDLTEVEALIEAYYCCSDEDRGDQLAALVKNILKPLVQAKVAKALWLQACLPNAGNEGPICDTDFETQWLSLIKEAAFGGCAEAQYSYGCELYDEGKYDEAHSLYQKSAAQGYAPSLWCYGLEIINGIGETKNISKGLYYIRLAAENRYEYAVEFLIRAYTEGEYGLSKDQKEVKKWESVLQWLLLKL